MQVADSARQIAANATCYQIACRLSQFVIGWSSVRHR